jgi:hypothetical protein
VTLNEMRKLYPALFYGQTWYVGERFMDIQPTGKVPAGFFIMNGALPKGRSDVRAVDLAALYLENPSDPRFRRFLWTDDYDKQGFRVYVGGVGEYGIDAFQIHRQLTVDARWGWVA